MNPLPHFGLSLCAFSHPSFLSMFSFCHSTTHTCSLAFPVESESEWLTDLVRAVDDQLFLVVVKAVTDSVRV